mmetsp:Transcript_12921/g.24689  ORF Transcript_12921/g.24689 Transcript_12921/m.24689 type:complete len:582 (-) Transcript_12921:281-2026(-)
MDSKHDKNPPHPGMQEVENKKRRLHLHFGAGSRGLGTMLGAIEKSGCSDYAVIQRPSKSWRRFQNRKILNGIESVQVRVNGEPVGKPMVVVRGKDAAERIAKTEGPFFVASYSWKALEDVTKIATSLSCSLQEGAHGMLDVLRSLPRREKPPRLFTFEVDNANVIPLAEELADRVTFVPCVADRMCASNGVSADGFIDIQAETSSGHLVVLPKVKTPATSPPNTNPPSPTRRGSHHLMPEKPSSSPTGTDASSSDSVAFGAEINPISTTTSEASVRSATLEHRRDRSCSLPLAGVIRVSGEAEGDFFVRRKTLLFDSTQLIVSLVLFPQGRLQQTSKARRRPDSSPRSRRQYSRKYSHNILKPKPLKVDEELFRKELWAWAVAQCALLVEDTTPSVLMSALDAKSVDEAVDILLQYSWDNVKRVIGFLHSATTVTARTGHAEAIKNLGVNLRKVGDLCARREEFKALTVVKLVYEKDAGALGWPGLGPGEIVDKIDGLVKRLSPVVDVEDKRRAHLLHRNKEGKREVHTSLSYKKIEAMSRRKISQPSLSALDDSSAGDDSDDDSDSPPKFVELRKKTETI